MYEYEKKIIAFLLLHFSPKFIAIMQYFNNTESYWIIAFIAFIAIIAIIALLLR